MQICIKKKAKKVDRRRNIPFANIKIIIKLNELKTTFYFRFMRGCNSGFFSFRLFAFSFFFFLGKYVNQLKFCD